MGVVYRATQNKPIRRDVALKLIHLGLNSRQFLTRFEGERQALAMMDHHGVARVYDAGVAESGQPYLAMELVDGVPLTEYCERKRLSVEKRLTLFIAVCNAVQHAHQKGVIHRDLKPSNVLVTEVDGEPTPKIIDFGIAKAISGRLSDSTLMTAEGGMIGTPEYMPPEQAQVGAIDVDTQSDVYSLGVMLYETLTGRLPFDSELLRAKGYDEARRIILELEPVRPSLRVLESENDPQEKSTVLSEMASSLSRRLRGDLDWIVMRCLEKDRDRRYESAGDLARDIRRHLENEPIDAGPPTVTYKLGKFVKRHRKGVVAGAFVAVLGIAGVITLNILLVQAIDARREAELQGDIARAVNAFLTEDLLAAADPTKLGRDITVVEAVDLAAEKVAARFADQPIIEASIRKTLGSTYNALGKFDNSETQLAQALKIMRAAFPPNDRRIIQTQHELSMNAVDKGDLAQARQALSEVIAANERQLGPKHPTTIANKADMVLILMNESNYAEAEKLALAMLELRKEIEGDQAKTFSLMNNLGNIYQATGRPELAEPMIRQAKAAADAEYGVDHPTTLRITESLAWACMSVEKLEEAEQILRDLHKTRTRVLGPEHPSTVSNLHSLSMCLYKQQKIGEGIETMAVTTELAHKVWPADSWKISAMQTLYGDLLYAGERYADAEEVLVDAYERVRDSLGPDHRIAQVAVRLLVKISEETEQPEKLATWREKLTPVDYPE